MCKQSKFPVALVCYLLSLILLFGGCAAKNSGADSSKEKIYSVTLADGIRLIAAPRPSMDQMYFDFSAETDGSQYSAVALADPPTQLQGETPRSVLAEDASGKKTEALLRVNGQAYDHNTRAYFPISYDAFHSYQLEVTLNGMVVLAQPMVVDLPLDRPIQILQRTHDLPDGHFIRMDEIRIVDSAAVEAPAFDAKKLAAIYFTTDSDNLTYDLQVKKSELSVGAASGALKELSRCAFVYYHPLAEGETNLTLAFESISYYRTFSANFPLAE